MKRPGIVLICSSGCILSVLFAKAQEVDLNADLDRLDQIVRKRAAYMQQKQQEIDELQQTCATPVTPTEQYGYYKRLYDAYLKFKPDSAERYAALCKEVVLSQINTRSNCLQTELDAILITIFRGNYYKAKERLNAIGPIDSLPAEIRPKLAMAYLEFYMRLAHANAWIDRSMFSEDPEALWMQYRKYMPSDSWLTDYYEANLLNAGNSQQLLCRLEAAPKPSIQAAMLEYALSKIYASAGDEKLSFHYQILSAINDIVMANCEAQSLISIVNSPQIDKSSSRAFDYVMACTENAYAYKDIGRSLEILKAHASVTRAFEKRLSDRAYYLTAIVVLQLLSVVAIGVMFISLNRKKRRQAELLTRMGEMNEELQQMIAQDRELQQKLKQSNALLHEEIAYRNHNFMNVYQMVSQYMHDVQNFCKMEYNLITAGKIEKARNELKVMKESDKYLQNFYTYFDRAFLSSHPDFLERFNALLKTECRIPPPAGKNLTPELRIYALVSIGICDSVGIAEFLHYSPQTIYNYRLKIRRNACIPEKDFADTVAAFYQD